MADIEKTLIHLGAEPLVLTETQWQSRWHLQVTEKSEVMLISEYWEIIRIESKFIREVGAVGAGCPEAAEY